MRTYTNTLLSFRLPVCGAVTLLLCIFSAIFSIDQTCNNPVIIELDDWNFNIGFSSAKVCGESFVSIVDASNSDIVVFTDPAENNGQIVGLYEPIDSLIIDGGIISTTDQTSLIVNDDLNDVVSFELTDDSGDHSIWIVTDSLANVVSFHDQSNIDFEGSGEGKSFVYHLSYENEAVLPEVGTDYLNIIGQFDYSNGIEIQKIEGELICAYPEVAVHFDLEDCRSYLGSSDMDYSEFTAFYPNNPSCTDYKVIGDHLYRQNPRVNKHSCTPGVDGHVAMCVMSMDGCEFVADNEQAIRFEIEVTPEEGEEVYLSGLQFYEQAPEFFVWIFGETGLNNYPLYYGLRVLRDGQEVYLQEDIETETEWNLEVFDFSSLVAFKVQDTTVFSFELLAYCRVGIESDIAVWDIDEISILSCCELCDVVGGDISSDSESLLCDNSDQSQELSIELTEGTGDSNLLFILDDQGRILSYQDSLIIHPDSIILDSFIVQSISYSGMVTGLEVGAFVSDLNGCFNLSNQLEFVKVIPMGGELSSNNSLLVCLGDGLPDIINFTVDNDQGDNSFFIITDNSGAISDVITDSSYDFEGTPPGICFVFHVSYYGNLEGLEIGSDINEIDGCFHLSNSLQITKDCDLLGAISGYVYKVDGLTEDRLGVEGVTITLIDMDGNIVKTAETNADGYYIFQVLESGSYSVFSPGPETGCEDVSDQDESTDPFNDPDGGSDPVNNAIPVNLDTGENDEDNNFVDAVTIVIPVELIGFDAFKEGSMSRLEWTTAIEINNSHFMIERSADGKDFREIGEVLGAGTSLEVNNYKFYDKSPVAESNYYRLAQYDFDGAMEYSEIRIIEFDNYLQGTASVKVFPTSVVDFAFLDAEGLVGDVSLFIFDARGAIVRSEVIRPRTQFDLSDLAAGQYIFKMYDQDRYLIGTEKIIVIEE